MPQKDTEMCPEYFTNFFFDSHYQVPNPFISLLFLNLTYLGHRTARLSAATSKIFYEIFREILRHAQ